MELYTNFSSVPQKREINDPTEGSKYDPMEVNTGGKSVGKDDWSDYGIVDVLNDDWDLGGFSQYITFVPTDINYGWGYNMQTRQKEQISNKVIMHCPLLGYTIDNPRTFWVVVN